jgi:thiosulfate dehydrogenase [quinone] large subunit
MGRVSNGEITHGFWKTKPPNSMKTSKAPSQCDMEIAHGLARLALGLNILGHGLSRIGNIPGFAVGLEKMFAATQLPSFAVTVTAYTIPPVELIVGALLVLGFLLRPALIVGALLLCQLTFGAALTQQWDIAGIQLIYVGIYGALLATAGFDRYSTDQLLRRGFHRKLPHAVDIAEPRSAH